MRVPGSKGATVYNPIFLHFKMKRIKSPILLMISVRVMQRVKSRLNSVLFYCWDSLVTLGCSKVRRGGYSGSIARGAFSQSGVRSTGVDVWLSAVMFWIYMRLNIKAPQGENLSPAAVRRFNFVKHIHLFCTRPSRMLLVLPFQPSEISDSQHNQNKPSPRKHNTFQMCATLRCNAQIKTSCLELHRFYLTNQKELCCLIGSDALSTWRPD